MPTGTVKFFNSASGYGFIAPEDGSKDVFVHISAVEEAGLNILTKGQKVEYEVVSKRDGKTAAGNLKLAD
jgi:CspA family cold shock protein